MKKHLLLLTIVFSLFFSNVFAQTVHITKTGKKYHNENCRYLSQSSSPVSLSDAIAKGLTPCSVCKPTTNNEITAPSRTKSKSVEKDNQEYSAPSKNNNDSYTSSVQCSATTKKGTQCKRMTKSPNGRCWQHGGN